MTDAPAPGIYYDVPEGEYRAWDALNWSLIKRMAHAPAAFRYFQTTDETDDDEKAHLELGKALHMAVLQPAEFARRYITAPQSYPTVVAPTGWTAKQADDTGMVYTVATGRGGNRKEFTVQIDHASTTALTLADDVTAQIVAKPWNKNANYCGNWEKRQAEAGMVIISPRELRRVRTMADALWSLKATQLMLDGAQTEVSIVWPDQQTGLLCKARIDAVNGCEIADLKTTGRSAAWERFCPDCLNYGYAGQAAFYRDGYDWATRNVLKQDVPEGPMFRFLVVESNPPYLPAVYDLYDQPDAPSAEFMEHGRQLYHGYLQQIAYCQKHDSWPGHNPGPPDQQTEPMELVPLEWMKLQGRIS